MLGTSVAVLLAACSGGATSAPAHPSPSALPTASTSAAVSSPSPNITPTPAPTATPIEVPPGRILFNRQGSDGVEHYFTIKTDGTDEHAVFDAEGCGCAHWMAD